MADSLYICGYVLSFSDGGSKEEQVLCRGSKEECDMMMDLIPAISYSGDRPDPEARMVVVKLGEGE